MVLRPERMSKVSVTGSRRVMEPVIEAVHELNLVHLSDYDGSWEGFDNGDPIEGAENASERLVTVRSLESQLDLEEGDAAPGRLDGDWETSLEEIRTRINELDDRRSEVREQLRRVEERIDRVEPFAELGIDLDLLSGYDTVDVVVGEGDAAEVEAAVDRADGVRAFETFEGDGVVAVVAAPAAGADDDFLEEALVGVDFARLEVPETDQSPETYVGDLEDRRRELESEIEEIDSELERIRRERGEFLLRVEEELTIDVQRAEAPLKFATTDHAFVAEGWIPSNRYDDLVAALSDDVGDSVEIEELVRADYDDYGRAAHTEEVDHGRGSEEETAEAEEEEEEPPTAVADGGTASARAGAGGVVTMRDDPPVIQDNVGPAKPFEFLLKMINRPKYSELDPTVMLLLTFPAFYGFMLGDLGYGMLYAGIGYVLYSRFDDDVIRSLGAIGLWAGGFTMLFGILYGEIFGLHALGDMLYVDGPPMRKGLQPAFSMYGETWLIASVLIGLLHLTAGYAFAFANDLRHGALESYFEHGSWAVLMIGVWIWIFSRHLVGPAPDFEGPKPDFLYTALGSGDEAAYALGFTGFPAEVGLYVGLPLAAIGLVSMIYGEVKHYGALGILIGGLESFNVLGDVLSYLRIAAVLLAKAGMALVVNMLFFGVYVVETETGPEWHFGTSHSPEHMLHEGVYNGHEVTEVMFSGLLHGGLLSALVGVVVLVVGHLVVLMLGVTSAGLQGIRLEYVEFFNKFYEGGGRKFEPFGHERSSSEE